MITFKRAFPLAPLVSCGINPSPSSAPREVARQYFDEELYFSSDAGASGEAQEDEEDAPHYSKVDMQSTMRQSQAGDLL